MNLKHDSNFMYKNLTWYTFGVILHDVVIHRQFWVNLCSSELSLSEFTQIVGKNPNLYQTC